MVADLSNELLLKRCMKSAQVSCGLFNLDKFQFKPGTVARFCNNQLGNRFNITSCISGGWCRKRKL